MPRSVWPCGEKSDRCDIWFPSAPSIAVCVCWGGGAFYSMGFVSAVEGDKEENGLHRRKEKEKRIQEGGAGLSK